MLQTRLVHVLLAALVSAACTPWVLGQNLAPAAPATAADLRAEAIAARLDREVAAQGLVGISVAIVLNGAVEMQLHRGFEDREAGVKASEATMYRWASISKPITAVAMMQLVEKGRLDLDADVRTLVPEWPEKPWPVTSRQLLGHLGGVVHYSNGPVLGDPARTDVPHPYEDVVDALGRFARSPLVCEPGTKYSYTTHGYILLAAVVQRAGGEPYWAQVRTRIAAPAGMTTFRPDYQWESIPHRAVGYRRQGEGEAARTVRSTDTDVSWKLGGGGYISTVADLARFSIAMMDVRLVSPETRARMWTEQTTQEGAKTGYGLGFSLGNERGRRTVGHSGSQEKTATYLLMAPESRVGVAVMCNTEGASLNSLAKDLVALAAPSTQQKTRGEGPAGLE